MVMASDLYQKYDYFLVIDLEATCCDLKSIPHHEMEIIEIGAVMVHGKSLDIVAEYQTFIKPVCHPILTNFCTELTSITQEVVNNAPSFKEAIASLQKWLSSYPNSIFCSWGDYDRKQFILDSSYSKIELPYPIPNRHLNLKQLFTDNQNLPKKMGMKDALKLAQIELVGTHHRGIDDARNIAKLMPYILGREKLKIGD
jgi:inhibitor of KinA sporulation pathway (predicted exonuclease)